jgi:hypothetical protein
VVFEGRLIVLSPSSRRKDACGNGPPIHAEGPAADQGNYATITGAPPSTITRDLSDLVEKGTLLRSGERRATRYRLNIVANA